MTGRWEDDKVILALSRMLRTDDGVPPWFASTLAEIRALPEVRS